MAKKDLVRELRKGPNLDQYLKGRKKRYTTYGLGAGMYSLNYYSFVRLCKEAGANIQIKKKVIVDLDILDAYLESVINTEIILMSKYSNIMGSDLCVRYSVIPIE